MQINVRTHHIEITNALKEYSQKKIQKLEKYFDNIQEIQIELDIINTAEENKRQIAMAVVFLAGSVIRAKESSADMYASIDLLYEKLEKQIRKHKEKLRDRKHKESSKLRTIASIMQKPKKTSIFTKKEQDKYYLKKPISPEEAAQMLELKKVPFLVFRNSQTETVSVLYELDNGNYGLIET